jgi:hypothetical protein
MKVSRSDRNTPKPGWVWYQPTTRLPWWTESICAWMCSQVACVNVSSAPFSSAWSASMVLSMRT